MLIKLNTIEDVMHFIRLAEKTEEALELKADRYVVSAKSILGVLSLDLTEPVILTAEGMDSDTIRERYPEFKQFSLKM